MAEPEDTAIRVWHLDEADISPAVAKLTKINERAQRQGLQGRYTWRLGEEHRTPVYLDQDDPSEREPDYYEITREFIVDGQPPKIAGWTFLATLTWDDGVLVTHTVPGFPGKINETGLRERWCDHCQTGRYRNDTYLVQNEAGERRQVGSTCIKDFLGHDFRPSWVSAAGLDEMERSLSGRVTEAADPATVLAYAASLTAKTGWISQEKAEADYRAPSSDTLRELLFGAHPRVRELRQELRPGDEHRAEAAKVREWARNVDASQSEYLANVKRLASAELISPRNTGILGSAVASHHREHARETERKAHKVSQFVGQPKEKLNLDVTVKGESVFETNFGVTHLYTLTDSAGNLFKWFASRDQGWQAGQQVKIRATVKGHETYHDIKQTVITRAKALEQPDPEPQHEA